ncbi:hypothetical protein BO71DRAFT_449291 [Aspergillus ellipticus CBS 707.79]|uniref:Protein-lysine N-methyltransferase EFM4 n=1 Tax=Aspergillus ellipticus CBS 707.79 TaxID=1448320 RepID=A0A319DDS4_9EURO|nr:hypothetical protein BO71DRAFT_449291 [Aspergillus ellipticus CBS 707.79]
MAEASHPAHLSPSELGTKDYWETFYARTLSHISTKHSTNSNRHSHPTKASSNPSNPSNHTNSSSDEDSDSDDDNDVDDDSDPGTSWFSEHNAPDKVLQFLTDEEFPLAPCNTIPATTTSFSAADGEKESPQPCILDLGTGNGSMLALLRKRGGFRGEMVGVDYSARSVMLARELQRLRIHSAYLSDSEDDSGSESGCEGGDTNIRFEEWDILHSTADISRNDDGEGSEKEKLEWFPYDKGGFDIVLDKGTFDAVSLSDEVVKGHHDRNDKDEGKDTAASGKKIQRRVCERYPGVVRGLVRKGGFVVVTSCNWTEEELVRWFTASADAGDRLVVWGRVEYPRFRFGGREGQGVVTVCFQRVE